ncbi:hypothetical protein SLEP1_g30881 [Rubroshorea leprosula]|uniref:Uncharacterized protein n=1 Tax=Rubroshorea leprosula TaxID=152421 RepID=A0AAV5K6X1_9ROSI|nr:hypothetical protein SLEP1_g30881 [Rubroshorea leprosula]
MLLAKQGAQTNENLKSGPQKLNFTSVAIRFTSSRPPHRIGLGSSFFTALGVPTSHL